MYWDSATLKARAKNVLRFSYWKSVLSELVAGAISAAGGIFLAFIMVIALIVSFTASALNGYRSITPAGIIGIILIYLLVIVGVFLFKILVSNPLEAGLARYYSMSRYSDARIENIFFSFKNGRYGNTVKALFLRDLYLFLWSLLYFVAFFIVGLISTLMPHRTANIFILTMMIPLYIGLMVVLIRKYYAYFMIPYIMAENPSIPVKRAFDISKAASIHEKGSMFYLDLSFIGWTLLAGLATTILPFTGGAAMLFLLPYINATRAELYFFLRYKSAITGITGPHEIAYELFLH